MRTRYIANPMAPDGHPSAPILRDPIFMPIFSALLGSLGSISIVSGVTVAGLASAIAAISGFMEFPNERS